MLIKSSMESEELAYDTANIVYKRVGPTYDKWWMKEGYGQNYAWVVAEHSDYSVRLFFEFMDTGFCYVKVHFTNGASYEDLIADSWNYAKESPEYPFEETCDHVRNFLDNFFEVGGGMDKLRAKYEKGNNSYDVDSYIEKDGYVKNSRKSSRKPIKSGRRQEVSNKDFINKLKSMKSKGWSTNVVGYYENDLDTDEQRLYVSGGEYTFTNNDDERRKLSRQIMALNGGEGIGYKKKNFEDVINSSRRPIKSSINNIEEHGVYHNDTWNLEVVKLVGNTALLKPVKDDSYFCVKNPKIDEDGDLVWTSDTLPMTDYDTALKEFNYHKDLNNASPTFNSRRPVKSSADNLPSEVYYIVVNGSKQYYDTYNNAEKDLEYLIQYGNANVGGVYTETDPEEIQELYEVGYIGNSRKPVKSDWKREAEFMNDRIRDDNLLYQVFKIEDEHFGGNFENPDNWDGTHIVYTIENGEITNTEIVDSFEDVIDDGNKYYLSANRDTGYRNTDYVLDRVALWQERNNRGITSSRKPIKSSFIVGKQDNGTKVYYCEDGQYYAEEDYTRPSIKIFDNEADAKKIAKRSKNGFATPLEVE